MSNSAVPRPEYPRPQFVRVDAHGSPDWVCLNGAWEFSIDSGDSGLERNLPESDPWDQTIQVPFCPESELSGVHHLDFMAAVWYRRTVTLPAEWSGKSVRLHFGAVDYDATVWALVDDPAVTTGAKKRVEVGRHRGGFTPFECHLDRAGVTGGDTVTLVVRARDTAQGPKPRGKQSTRYAPYACLYTRTTGIWQTVWLEALPNPAALKRTRITPDLAAGCFRIEQPLTNNPRGYTIRATVADGAGQIAETIVRADLDLAPRLDLPIPADRQRVWATTDPFLYDLTIELRDATGAVVDKFVSYAGLRSVTIDGRAVKINGKAVYQRLVLDQGYYPESVMTAPSEEKLIADITLSMAIGFNGARLHQKVFEERFLYHADRLGYLVWGEFGDWGCGGYGPNHDHQQQGVTYAAQFLESLERDYSHPAIVGWCPLNETWQNLTDQITTLDDATRALFLACKAMDTTRPVLDTSGYSHRVYETDIYDSHDYIGDASFAEGLVKFEQRQGGGDKWVPYLNDGDGGRSPFSLPYAGQPYFCSEFGGFKWIHVEDAAKPAADGAQPITTWGYGQAPQSIEDFYQRFDATCRILMDNPNHFGFCYTQLTDIYPEENGMYTFGRILKFDAARLKGIVERPAAIEGV